MAPLASAGRPARTQQAVILHPRPKELIPCFEGPRQTRTPTARPPGPGAGSIRPQAVNKEKARGSLGEPRRAHAASEGTCSPQGVAPQARGLRVFLHEGQPLPRPGRRECTASPNPLAHCRLSRAHPDKGDGGDRRFPGAATPARPAARTGFYLHVTQLHA